MFLEKDMKDYDLRRMLLGIPEGHLDIQTGTALPLESNFDYISGSKFS